MKHTTFGAAAFACALTALGLTGCGAVKSVVNNNLPAVDDALRLEGRSVSMKVPNRSRAIVTATGSAKATFNDFSISNSSQIHSAKVQLTFGETATVTVPSGGTYPASFTLTGLKAKIELKDAGRQVQVEANAKNATLTFNRVGATQSYTVTVSGGIGINDLTIPDVPIFLNILSTPGTDSSNSNTAEGFLEGQVDDSIVPPGSTIALTCTNGDAKVGI